ncbi:MAG TPA: hypothetical protein VKB17_04505 [Thermoleophilaceae bacterium]|nr:hypothetical protein [Thermoleophilaceae bacterium]
MAFILAHFEIDDYDAWKRERFDQDPAGRKQVAKNHVIARGVDDPSQVFVRVEFDSPEEAASFRERLMESGALKGIAVKVPPTVVEVADSAEY